MLDENDKKEINTIISDALAGAGESFAQQARTAAQEVLTGVTTQVEQLAVKVSAGGEAKVSDEALNNAVKTALQQQAQTAATQQAEAQAKQNVIAARDAFLKEKAPKLPSTYAAMIPETDKVEDLQAGLDKAVAKFNEDLTSAGIPLPSLGSSANGQEQAPVKKSAEQLAAMPKAERDAYLQQVAVQ